MLTDAQCQIILDALKMAEQSNTRMQNSKPRFHAVFAQIAQDITETTLVVQNIRKNIASISPSKQK